MTKKIFFVILFLLMLFPIACEEEESEKGEEVTEEKAEEEVEEKEKTPAESTEELVKDWISATTTFVERKGKDLEINEVTEKEEGVYEVSATFLTEFVGYGEMENEIATAPKETMHEILVVVEEEEVVQATLNEEFDEIKGKRVVEIHQSDLDWRKEVVNRSLERQEKNPLEGEMLLEVAKDRQLRHEIAGLLFDEWEINISQEEIENEILDLIEEDGWQGSGIDDLETFFQFQEEVRNYDSREIIEDIEFELSLKELYEKIDSNMDVEEETLKAAYEDYVEETSEDISFEEAEEMLRQELFSEKITDNIVSELERKREKADVVIVEEEEKIRGRLVDDFEDLLPNDE